MQLVRSLVILAALLASTLLSAPVEAAVWSITSDWTLANEDEYGAWIQQMTAQPVTDDGKIQSPLFEPGGALYGLPVDCADFVYATRVIFAAEHGLPFVSSASFNRKRLDASKNSWDSIPQPQRLRAFLIDVVSGAGTASLLRDTTPITEISRAHVKAGTILLAAQSVGHAWLVRDVRPTGIPELVFGSVPALEELFYRDGLPRGEAVFDKLPGGSLSAGFRSFCIAGKSCPAPTNATKLEWRRHQDWRPLTLRALQVRPEPLIESIGREIRNMCREAKARVVLTKKAAAFKAAKNQCLRGADYYNYSTENRDSRFKEGFLDLWELWMTTNAILDESREGGKHLAKPLVKVLDQISQVFSDGDIDEQYEDIVCPVVIDDEKPKNISGDIVARANESLRALENQVVIERPTILPLRNLRQLSLANRFSPDPNESHRARWGLEPELGLCLPSRAKR